MLKNYHRVAYFSQFLLKHFCDFKFIRIKIQSTSLKFKSRICINIIESKSRDLNIRPSEKYESTRNTSGRK